MRNNILGRGKSAKFSTQSLPHNIKNEKTDYFRPSSGTMTSLQKINSHKHNIL